MHLLLVLMVVIWGANYSLIKVVLRELPPPVFNALRLLVASGVFLILLAFTARTRPTRRDWIQLAGLGLYGQFLYQLFFLNGMSRTSVANASLIIGLVPLVVALTNAALGLERLSRAYWIGIAVSVVGMYFVVGLDAGMSTTSLIGDALTFGAVLAWSAYTVAAKPLLTRHSPIVVTGWSMALGTVFYLPLRDPRHARGRLAAGERRRVDRHLPVGAARAQPVLRVVEHRRAAHRQLADRHLLEPDPGRRGRHRRDLAARADRSMEGDRRRADRRRARRRDAVRRLRRRDTGRGVTRAGRDEGDQSPTLVSWTSNTIQALAAIPEFAGGLAP